MQQPHRRLVQCATNHWRRQLSLISGEERVPTYLRRGLHRILQARSHLHHREEDHILQVRGPTVLTQTHERL